MRLRLLERTDSRAADYPVSAGMVRPHALLESWMARWIVKALAQRTIGFMPNPDYWSDLVQRKIAGSVDLTYPFFLSRLDVARKNLEACARENSPAEVLELGTGWFPIVPLALRLAGASQVRTCDIV